MGEKLDGLEAFHPERMAARILGMGDILSLVEEARKGVDEVEAKKLAEKFKKGKGFDLEDFKGQIQQMKKMGGLASLVDKLPAQFAQAAAQAPQTLDDRALRRVEGIINSMTPQERSKPELIKASRKRRIATGAGVPVQEVNRLLNQFDRDAEDDEADAEGRAAENDAGDEAPDAGWAALIPGRSRAWRRLRPARGAEKPLPISR